MQRHLNLVENDFEKLEKRVLPRFPFCYLTFRCSNSKRVYEVKDISFSGMQLELKSGDIDYTKNDQISGEAHWRGEELVLYGNVKWVRGQRLGVEFSNRAAMREEVNGFLSVSHIVQHLRPIHQVDYGVELPTKLKYWLRSDGPVELFVWQHSDGELAKFQFIIMENFVEWEDGVGLQTGRVISKRDVDTPLIAEDEFVFRIDNVFDEYKVEFAKKLVSSLNDELLSSEGREFVLRKLG